MSYEPPISQERRDLYAPPPLPPTVRIESASPQGLALEHLGIRSESTEVIRHFSGEIINIHEGDYVSVDVPVISPNETYYVEQVYTLDRQHHYRVVEDAGGYTAEDIRALEEQRRGHNLSVEELAAASAEASRAVTEAIYGQPLSETSTYFAPWAESVSTPFEDVVLQVETTADTVIDEPVGDGDQGDNPNGVEPGTEPEI